MSHPRSFLLATSLVIVSTAAYAQPASDPTGHWEGGIAAPSGEIRIELDLGRKPGGAFFGTLGNPAKKLTGLPLAAVTVQGDSVRFEIKGSLGSEVFQGTLLPDGRTLAGEFSTQGGAAPFSLTRTGDARFEATPRSPAITRQLEGAWSGSVEADGKRITLLLKLTNHGDGTSTGVLVSAEGMEIAITRIAQDGASVRLDVSRVGGAYEGKLDSEAGELAGTWTQGPVSLPLTFKRRSD
jgi:hypothetical protein